MVKNRENYKYKICIQNHLFKYFISVVLLKFEFFTFPTEGNQNWDFIFITKWSWKICLRFELKPSYLFKQNARTFLKRSQFIFLLIKEN
jgi:hypothetical protein